jgi:FkbM family methyltransferase
MLKTIDSRWGATTFFIKDEYVGRSLWYYGEYNPDETEKIIELANSREGICLDIGANIGVISQALLCSGHKVHAWEPQPEVFKLLRKNATAATVHNAAVGDVAGVVQMPKVHYSVKGNFGGLGIGGVSRLGTYDVPVVTIDSYDLPVVGFIKLDVEGYEILALRGAINTITRDRPILYVEDDRGELSVELRKFITSLNYSIVEHRPHLFREKNFFNCSKMCWDRVYASHNLICTPL